MPRPQSPSQSASQSAMLRDVLNQPASLAKVIAHQTGPGAPAIAAAAAILRRARRVVFTGMGSSLFASIPAACFLSAHGIAAEALDTSELLYFRAKTLTADTAVVLVSRSGETVEILKLLPALSAAGTPVVAVTNEPGSSLARSCSNPLLTNSDPDKLVAVQTYTATLTTLLLLAAAVVESPFSAAALPAALDSAVRNALAADADWAQFLAGAPVVYLLGRGPSMASACEAALLFNEAARTPSVPISIPQFRHGPVEVVSPAFRGIVFASAGPTFDLDRALAADLEALGASMRTCTAEVPAPAPAAFAPVLEIVPVEIAVCALAESKGFEPGSFRFATQVTSAESGFGSAHST